MMIRQTMLAVLTAIALATAPPWAAATPESQLPTRGTVQVRDIPPDPAMVELLAPYAVEVAKWNTPIGNSAVTMLWERREKELGSWICDVLSEEIERRGHPVDFSIFNSGGIRTSLDAGPITYRNIASILPFENTAVVFEASGTQVRELVAYLAKTEGKNCVSGIRIHVNADLTPGEVTIGGEPIDDTRTYRFVTNNFLAAGGGGFTFWSGWKQHDTLLIARDLVADHIRTLTAEGKSVQLPAEPERYTFEKKEESK